MNYAVVVTYSYDDDTAVYLFEDEISAKRFLRDNYETELRIDVQENFFDARGQISDDGWYAMIECFFDDHSDQTEFRVGRIYQ